MGSIAYTSVMNTYCVDKRGFQFLSFSILLFLFFPLSFTYHSLQCPPVSFFVALFFCHVYLRSFLLCGVFIPKYMTIFLQTRIYMRTKKPIYIRYKQACVYGVTESCRIRGTELYRQQKNPSCTMELKSNFSLN